MEYATFRKWLAEHGCRFDTQPERRGAGHGTLVIHRAGRTAELPLVGESHNLDPRSVRQVCEALGLDWSKLPGPDGRVLRSPTGPFRPLPEQCATSAFDP